MGSILLMVIVVFIAAIVQSTSGFGFGIVCTAILPMVMPYKQAVPLILLTCMFLQVVVMVRLWKHISWKLLILPAVGSIICSSISVNFMLGLSDRTLHLILGIFLWVLALYMIFLAPKVKLKGDNPWIGLVAGSLSGFMSGMFTIGGPPMVAYFDAIVDDSLTYQSTLQVYFFLTCSSTLVNNILHGNFTSSLVLPACFTVVSCLVGTLVGMKILHKISMSMVRRLAYLMMMVAGTYNLIQLFF